MDRFIPIYAFVALPLLAAAQQWNVVTQVSSGSPSGVVVTPAGPRQQPFRRQPPRTLDPHILDDFAASFTLMQDVFPRGDNLFTDVTDQYVAAIPNGFVEGEGGVVYSAAGDVYHLPHFFHNRTNPAAAPLPQRTPAQAGAACSRQYRRLATVIQRYGHMYYHWLEETLPRVVALQRAGALTPGTRLLTWGQPYEAAWLAALGVDPSMVVPYDPEALYCADTVLVPTPVPRITPPREALQSVRSALGVTALPEAQRDVIVYVSRQGEPTRRVANEESLLAAIRAAFPTHRLEVFKGGAPPAEAMALFQRARVVLGPHGAGLSHILFAAPGTTVVEFLFMADPPMMFWHTAAALDQEYWMIPVPGSYYMQPEMEVPVGEVMDVLAQALKKTQQQGACAPGTAGRAGGLCSVCPEGSYAFNAGSAACKLCAAGRVAPSQGASFCSTCHPGTFSNVDGTQCTACPAGTFSMLAGSSSPDQCLGSQARRRRLGEQALNADMLAKLSPVFAKQLKRRALIQGVQGGAGSMTQQELCAAAAAAGAMGDPYRGPYLTGGTSDLCPPPTSGIMVPPPSPYEPPQLPTVVLPPIDIGLAPVAPVAPVTPPLPLPTDPTQGDDSLNGTPVTEPEPEPPAPSSKLKKKVMDAWAIALMATACALILLPMLFCCGRWCVVRRRRSRQARAVAAAAAAAPASPEAGGSRGNGPAGKPPRPGDQFVTSNPTFNLKASSTNASSGAGSRHGAL